MFCRNCGKQIPESGKFCIGCGTKAEPVSQSPFEGVSVNETDIQKAQPSVVYVPQYVYVAPPVYKAPPREPNFFFAVLCLMIPFLGLISKGMTYRGTAAGKVYFRCFLVNICSIGAYFVASVLTSGIRLLITMIPI